MVKNRYLLGLIGERAAFIRSSLSAFLTTRISTDAIWLKSSIYKVFLQTVISFSK